MDLQYIQYIQYIQYPVNISLSENLSFVCLVLDDYCDAYTCETYMHSTQGWTRNSILGAGQEAGGCRSGMGWGISASRFRFRVQNRYIWNVLVLFMSFQFFHFHFLF